MCVCVLPGIAVPWLARWLCRFAHSLRLCLCRWFGVKAPAIEVGQLLPVVLLVLVGVVVIRPNDVAGSRLGLLGLGGSVCVYERDTSE